MSPFNILHENLSILLNYLSDKNISNQTDPAIFLKNYISNTERSSGEHIELTSQNVYSKKEFKRLKDLILFLQIDYPDNFVATALDIADFIILKFNDEVEAFATLETNPSKDLIKKTIGVAKAFNWKTELEIKILHKKLDKQEAKFPSLNSDFSEKSKKRILEFNTLCVEKEDAYRTLDLQLTEKARAEFNKLIQLQDDLKNIISSGTAQALSDAYKKFSEREKKSADRYRYFSLFLMGSAIVASVIYSYLSTLSFYELIAVKALILIALGIPITYLIKESSRHRNQQFSYENLSLKISSSEAFTANFERQDKLDIKKQMANLIFSSDNQHNSETTFNLIDPKILDVLTANLKK